MKLLLVGACAGEYGAKGMFLAPPLGIHRLSGFLRKYGGIEVSVLDPHIEDIEEELSTTNYDIIGFSIYHLTLENDLSLAYLCKKKSPQSLLIAGNEEATFNSIEILENSPIDVIVLGEGEKPLLQVIKPQGKGTILDTYGGIKGLIIKENRSIYRTGYNQPLSNEEFEAATMSIEFERMPYQKYWDATRKLYEKPDPQEIQTIRIYTGNYCPLGCAFCSSTNFLNCAAGLKGKQKTKVVYLSLERTLQLITKALQAQPTTKTIIFDDDNFMLNKKRVRDICAKILEYKGNKKLPQDLSFICQGRPDVVAGVDGRELLHQMKQAGFRLLEYGAESFCQHILDDLRKGMTVSDIWQAIDLTLQVGIKPHIYIILMPPTTTWEDLRITIESSLKAISMGCEVGISPYVFPLPGSDIAKEEGLFTEYKRARIPGTSGYIRKAEKCLPNDNRVRETALVLDRELPSYERYFTEKYRLRHFPPRIQSIIVSYAIYDIAGISDGTKEKAESLLQKLVSSPM